MARMDETNLHIIQLLQKNARMSMAELAQAVGRSESTVRERVGSLELKGLLKGYQAQVDWDQAGLPALAVIQARCDMSRVQEVAKQLAAIPNVTRALLLTGSKPILAMLRVRDIEHLQSLLKERFAAGELNDVEIQITLESLVDRRPPSLRDPINGRDTLAETGK
jgi:Lrp/AsnC family leucine-responsive transcriptional regulator